MTTVLVSCAALIVYFGLVCTVLRLTRQKHSLTVLLAAAGLVFFAVVVFWGGYVSFWHFVSYFSAEVIGVIFLYGLALKSLSFGMLKVLAESPNTSLTLDKLSYSVVRPAFLDRINVLAERRLIEESGGKYAATKRGKSYAAKIRNWRRKLKFSSSGLYGA